MKKTSIKTGLIIWGTWIMLCCVTISQLSCTKTTEEKQKIESVQKSSNFSIELLAPIPGQGIFKMTVDSTQYIVIRGVESITIFKHDKLKPVETVETTY